MFGSDILDVAVGLTFVYLVVSVACSSVREAVESLLKTRASYLEHAIREMLQDRDGTDLAKALYQHPLVFSLFAGNYKPGARFVTWVARGQLPSYIPSRAFAMALLDIAARGRSTEDDGPVPPLSERAIRANLSGLGNPAVQRMVQLALDHSGGDIRKTQAELEAWYNAGMDRVGGWYRRSTQLVIFSTGLLVAVGLNVNSITIADQLYRHGSERAVLVAQAESAAGANTPGDATDLVAGLEGTGLPIGWSGDANPFRDLAGQELPAQIGRILTVLGGWLLTALAATMGAPFWFDILNRFTAIRSSVKPKDPTPPADEPTPVPAASPGARPAENGDGELDGCSPTRNDRATADHELPAARGGVA